MRHRAKQIELYIRRRFLAYSRKPFSGELITKPKNVLLSDSPRILLLRQDRLGDVICSTPIVAALRQHFPTARIDLLLSHNNIALAELMYNWCNRLWCYNKTVASFLFLRHQLRRQHYDAVVDLMDNPSTTSTLFVRSIRAPIRIGIIKDNAWVYTHCVPLLDRERHHYIERIAQLLLPFGIDPSSVNLFPLYPLTHSDIAQAATALNLEHFPDRSGFVLVHISTRHTPLQWGWDRYHAMVAHLRAQLPELPIGIGSTPEDRTVAEAIAHQTGAFLLPHLSFHQYAAIVHFARLLISPDTAIVHAAAAMHIPSVVLYHQGNPALMPWYPYGAPYRALVVRGAQSVTAISPEAVVHAAMELLSGSPPYCDTRIFASDSQPEDTIQ